MSAACPPEFLSLAHALADAAGDVVRRYYRRPIPFDDKADDSPVTAADRETEQAIRERIEDARPDDGIIGEEFGAERTDAEFVWIVDPIDGTKSFITGRPIFGTLIALNRVGVPILGIIDQPIVGDRWVGAAGRGATLNGETIRVRACPGIAEAVMATTSPHLFGDREIRGYRAVEASVKHAVFGGDCYNYGLLAAGHVDLVIEAGLEPYDYCALVPVIEEAGGAITDWQGRPVRPESNGTILAAGDAGVHAAALALVGG